MILLAAVLAAVSVHEVWPHPATRRLRTVMADREVARRTPSPSLVVALCLPLLGLVLAGPWGLIGGAAAVPIGRRSVASLESGSSRRASIRERREVPTVLDLVAAAVSAGLPVSAALALVTRETGGTAAGRLGDLVRRSVGGLDPEAVWIGLVDDPVWSSLGRALRLAERTGMPVVRILESAADEARRTARAERRLRARAVGVKTAAPLGACFLPAFFAVGIAPIVIGLVGSVLP